MVSSSVSKHAVRFSLCSACLLWILGTALAQNPASYQGIQKGDFMKRWLVLGPIPITPDSASKPDEEFQKKAFATDWLASHGGETGIVPTSSATLTISGKSYRWQAVESNADTVGLENLFGKPNYVVAYVASEIVMPEAASVLLALGSDDGVKVWLNGETVHDHWVLRGLKKDEDLVPLKLRKGANRLLLKVQNGEGGWDSSAEFQTTKFWKKSSRQRLKGRPDLVGADCWAGYQPEWEAQVWNDGPARGADPWT